jgi:hypothetical protein
MPIVGQPIAKKVAPTLPERFRHPITFLGIDPGLGGGLALLCADEVRCCCTPADKQEILDLIRRIQDPCFAVLEKIPCAIYGSAKSSMAKLYGSYTAWGMALTACGIPHVEVMASAWQKGLGIPGRVKTGPGAESRRQWKGRLRDLAQERHPGLKVTLAVADALLLAEYARKIYDPARAAENVRTW